MFTVQKVMTLAQLSNSLSAEKGFLLYCS